MYFCPYSINPKKYKLYTKYTKMVDIIIIISLFIYISLLSFYLIVEYDMQSVREKSKEILLG